MPEDEVNHVLSITCACSVLEISHYEEEIAQNLGKGTKALKRSRFTSEPVNACAGRLSKSSHEYWGRV